MSRGGEGAGQQGCLLRASRPTSCMCSKNTHLQGERRPIQEENEKGEKSENAKQKQYTPGALLVVVRWRHGHGLGGPLGRRVLLRHFPHATEVAAAARYVKEAHAGARSHGRENECSKPQGAHAASVHNSAYMNCVAGRCARKAAKVHTTAPHDACHISYATRSGRTPPPPLGSGHTSPESPSDNPCAHFPSLDGHGATTPPILSPALLSPTTPPPQHPHNPQKRTGRTGTSRSRGARLHTSMAQKGWHAGTC